MIPKALKSFSAPKRLRMLEMLVEAVPYLLNDGNVFVEMGEDQANTQLREKLNCNKSEAELLIRLAMQEFPSLLTIRPQAASA